ncbi:MAG: NAD(P)/FAD-dependent oxidoreductase [Bacteroidia bacterium]
MKNENDYDVIIAGGGLAGLVAATLLSRAKKKVLLIEKKIYPFHKVCGEYVSNEVLSFLQSLGFDPYAYGASRINKLRISTPSGSNIHLPLEPGGFGLSRNVMDNALFEIAKKSGTDMLTSTRVTDILFSKNQFKVVTNTGENLFSKLVIGSYGKRDLLDKKLRRRFIQSRTKYLGVKYHVKINYPVDEIGLDNFENGYCGIVKIEEDKFNLCYLYKNNKQKVFKSIKELEEKVLFKNPVLKTIFSNSQFLFEEPEVINEISFASKNTVQNHILMCGDSAGLITPLCGNGMSMAIQAAKLLSGLILDSAILEHVEIPLEQMNALEKKYELAWKKQFHSRLSWGRKIQHIFGNPVLTGISIKSIHAFPKIEQWLISKTHG